MTGTALFAQTTTAAGPTVGVLDDPCTGVPLEATAAHQATTNPYISWIHDWLALDWAQQCRYRKENANLSVPLGQRIVFIGDSITDAWKALDPSLFTADILDRGISGQTTGQMLLRFRSDVLDLKPSVVHIMAGTNDIAGNTGPTSLARIQGNIESMVELAKRHGIRVVLGSIPPARHFWWRPEIDPADKISAMNAWLREYSKNEHLLFVDYFSVLSDEQRGLKSSLSEDGVHPNAAGYAAMRPLAEVALRQALSPRRK
jgi:lysophospholipase L1-like esterase